MHTPLTQQMRDDIFHNVMRDAPNDALTAHKEKVKESSARLYRALITEEQEKLMEQLPKDFFPRISDARVLIEAIVNKKVTTMSFFALFDPPRPVGYQMPYGIRLPSRRFYDEAVKLNKEWDEISATRHAFEAKVQTALKSCRTVDQLLKRWPEIKPYIPAGISRTKNEVALPVKELNELLGLPREEAEAA